MRLYDILTDESKNGRTPYHMPGHKRNPGFDYLNGKLGAIDFTEIDGLDDLHAPNGILADAMKHAASIYGADSSYFLVNGSTGGIISAIYSVASCGSCGRPLIIARNSHKSVYNAAVICGSPVSYVCPKLSEYGIPLDITPSDVKEAISKNPDSAAVVITSPTYDGVISDIRGIADVCHRSNIPLIVDAAHGAHLGFLDPTVELPTICGADITIMSLHKTLPSLTQTGILHVNGDLIDQEAVERALAIFETSSPSYILMASIDGCIHELEKRELFDNWRCRIEQIHEAVDGLSNTSLFNGALHNVFAFDISKLVVCSDNLTGGEISAFLRGNASIEPEMTSLYYSLLMTGAGDTDEMTKLLCSALTKMDSVAGNAKAHRSIPQIGMSSTPRMTMACAAVSRSENISIDTAEGAIAAEFIMPYPPGIPLLAPGELVTPEHIAHIRMLSDSGIKLITSRGIFSGNINVVSL